MSRLRDRIMSQGTLEADDHPAVTPETPMDMPIAEVRYLGETALYGTLHPLVTADGAVVAARSPAAHAQAYADVVPAQRP
jgi:hypothetical protein